MNALTMKELVIGHLRAKLPIIQGGMGIGISLSGLSSAVANQGGIGVIATAGIGMQEPGYKTDFSGANIRALRQQIQMARALSGGIIGVNIMVALSNFADMVKTAVQEKIDIIFSGAGLPLNLPSFVSKADKTLLVPIVSSGRAARLICKKWLNDYDYLPDALVVEGPKAGGHLGFKPEQIDDPNYSLEKLVADVLEEIKPIEDRAGVSIPVIAGGGIYTGKDIYEIMKLGASGVQMATRFVTTEECDASPAFKDCYIQAKAQDICIIKSPVGLPGRAIMNHFIGSILAGKKKPFTCPYHCITTCEYKSSPYCIALALQNAKNGRMNHGFAFAGANAYRANAIVSMKDLMETIKREYAQACGAQPALSAAYI